MQRKKMDINKSNINGKGKNINMISNQIIYWGSRDKEKRFYKATQPVIWFQVLISIFFNQIKQ